MRYKHGTIAAAEQERVFVEGKRAFGERKNRYNPYAASNQGLAMLWWHGWDTAEEESKGERSPIEERPI
jgi:hypothetical protein